MIKWQQGISLVLAGAAVACAGNPGPVPVVGDPGAVARLAGEWEGTYSSVETGRSGSILFRLTAGQDTAHGDVLMIPGRRVEPGDRDSDPETGAPRGPSPRLLSITFVQVGGDWVSGRLDPYVDPDCGCKLTTPFEGRLEGDAIEGRFFTRSAVGMTLRQGTWRATRHGGT
jgi:hypothetical protein